MNLLKFFEDLTSSFNGNSDLVSPVAPKCGLCWVFQAPLSEAGMNAAEFEEGQECCTKIFLTYYNYQSGFVKSGTTGLEKTGFCDYFFTIYVVQSGPLGVNVDKEQPGHALTESIWATVLTPLMDCLGCGNEFDLCDLGYDFDIMRWSMTPVILKHDENYSGWKIDGTFRQFK